MQSIKLHQTPGSSLEQDMQERDDAARMFKAIAASGGNTPTVNLHTDLDDEEIRRAIARWTGVPVSFMVEGDGQSEFRRRWAKLGGPPLDAPTAQTINAEIDPHGAEIRDHDGNVLATGEAALEYALKHADWNESPDGTRTLELDPSQFGLEEIQLQPSDALGSQSVYELVRWLERNQPELFESLYPRRYDEIALYHSPKIATAVLCMIALYDHFPFGSTEEMKADRNGPSLHNLLVNMAANLDSMRLPLMFLHPRFVDAILRTDFKEGIDWQAIRLPYESGCFILPRGIRGEDGDEYCCVFWTRQLDSSGKKIFGFFTEKDPEGFTHTILTDPILTPEALQTANYGHEMGRLLFGTFLALQSRQSLVQPGQRQRTVRKRNSTREFWTPNVVGANVGQQSAANVVRVEGEGGDGIRPRMHWRRGHFTHQVCGPGLRERRLLWIEPVLCCD